MRSVAGPAERYRFHAWRAHCWHTRTPGTASGAVASADAAGRHWLAACDGAQATALDMRYAGTRTGAVGSMLTAGVSRMTLSPSGVKYARNCATSPAGMG
jgi:hypothetical protein